MIEATAVIDAPAALAYAVIADYRDGHPHTLPRPPFVSLGVDEGGTGAGTVIRFQMRVLGTTRDAGRHHRGRVPVESDAAGDVVNTFTSIQWTSGRHASPSRPT